MANARAILLVLALTTAPARRAGAQTPAAPDTVVVHSGGLALRALLWRPPGRGPFPAVLFNHGGGQGGEEDAAGRVLHTMMWQAETLAPVFVRHGYVFLYPLRRGVGLSAGQGVSSSERWQHELAVHGQDARNATQLQLLESVELDDALAGLRFLRALPEVDARRIVVAGHSFGGSLTLLVAERDSALAAAVVFSGSALSWPQSPPLRERLQAAVAHTVVPIFFVYAANDYSVTPGEVLAAEMERLGKPHRLKIYPAIGHTAREGHRFVHRAIATWEPDVFAFLAEHTRR